MNVSFNLPPEIWLVTGASGTGKTAVARALAARFERAAHVDGEQLWRWIVRGAAWPEDGAALDGETERQYELAIRNQCLLARSYAEAGFVPVLDFTVASRHALDAYRHYLAGGALRLAVLAPRPDARAVATPGRAADMPLGGNPGLDATLRQELAGIGAWIDSSDLDVEQTVDAILAARKQALLP